LRLAPYRRSLLTALAAPPWRNGVAALLKKSRQRRVNGLLSDLASPLERRYLRLVSAFDDEWLKQLLSDDFHERLAGADPADFLLDAYRACPSRDFVTRTTCVDVLTYLPCDILHKVDIASMTYALEARCPILDQEVVDLAASMPIEWKIKPKGMKRILIETFADLIPPAIQQRGKMGFGIPLSHWFRGKPQPLLREVLLDRRSLERGLFRPETVERLVRDHVSGLTDHSYRLWNLLVLELWQQTYLDRPASARISLMKAAA
jgi:asparagine synthase (glutamine-hydrolysing)